MLKNYIIITFRNILRNKLFSFINIFGMALGLSVSILISLWVLNELSYDNFYENSDNIYRVEEIQEYGNNKNFRVRVTPPPLGPDLKENYPSIQSMTRLATYIDAQFVSFKDKKFKEQITPADNSIFEIFSFPFIEGDAKNALTKPNSIVINEDIAMKYFGSVKGNIGKPLMVANKYEMQVTGVIENIPSNTHLNYLKILTPFEESKDLGVQLESYGGNSIFTYILLNEGANGNTVEKNISDFMSKNKYQFTELFMNPLSNIYMNKYRRDSINTFIYIGLLIILLASINFMNLSTAESMKRAKEIGLKKVVGSNRKQIIIQFLTESVFKTFLAFFLALILAEISLPLFNEIIGKSLGLGFFSYSEIFSMTGFVILIGILSGLYPAIYLSSFSPIKIINGSIQKGKKSAKFRTVLVILQFTISIVLIINTTVIFKQTKFMNNRSLGFDKENIVYLQIDETVSAKYDIIKKEISKIPSVKSITASSMKPLRIGSNGGGWDFDGKDPDNDMFSAFCLVDYDYEKTFGIEMVMGRSFSPDILSDSLGIVINESFAKMTNYENPIGERITKFNMDFKIIGVMKDFHFLDMRNKITPLVMLYFNQYKNMYIKIDGDNYSETISSIKEACRKINPESSIEIGFVDKDLERTYRGIARQGKLNALFAGLAITISMLGLFALSIFMIQQKTKEIGIRKVMGASVREIVILLTKEFSKWIIISNIIAWPIAYYFIENWLNDFAYKMDIGISIFLISGIVSLGIALLTVSSQAFRTAMTNPVKALKYE